MWQSVAKAQTNRVVALDCVDVLLCGLHAMRNGDVSNWKRCDYALSIFMLE